MLTPQRQGTVQDEPPFDAPMEAWPQAGPGERKRTEFLAWIILWAGFGVFCLLAFLAFSLFNSYRHNAVVSQEAKVQVLSGTVLSRSSRQLQWVDLASETSLGEGDRLRTDGSSQAFATLFDYSTVLIYSNTEVHLTEMSSSRFDPRRQRLALAVQQGKVQVGVAAGQDPEKAVRLVTPHGAFLLEEGSYTVAVVGGKTQVRVGAFGRAQALLGEEAVAIQSEQRIELGPGGRISGPTPAEEDLVFNGDFAQGLNGWTAGNSPGFKEGADVLGEYTLTLDEGRTAVRFARQGSRNTHNETYLFQEIDRDVSDFSELRPSLEFRLEHQSLSGGGYLGSEYPVVLRVTYRSAAGDSIAGYGFYYHNLANNRTDDGIPVPGDVWVKFTGPTNLMTLSPPPKRILSIQVSASGWDYRSLVTNVALTGR